MTTENNNNNQLIQTFALTVLTTFSVAIGYLFGSLPRVPQECHSHHGIGESIGGPQIGHPVPIKDEVHIFIHQDNGFGPHHMNSPHEFKGNHKGSFEKILSKRAEISFHGARDGGEPIDHPKHKLGKDGEPRILPAPEVELK